MSLKALERLESSQSILIAALDADDIAAIERGVDALRDAAGAVRAVARWDDHPELRQVAFRVLALTDAARVRVNFLTDDIARRIENLAAARGAVPDLVYRRPGRRTA